MCVWKIVAPILLESLSVIGLEEIPYDKELKVALRS